MNKAFVRESDSEDDEELSPALQLPAGMRNYITPAGHARLKSELEHLIKPACCRGGRLGGFKRGSFGKW